PPHAGRQHEPRLIKQDQVGAARRGLLHEAREFLAEPAGDLVLVALAGLALRFLAGPAQARAEAAADAIGIVGDGEMPAGRVRRAACQSWFGQPWALAPCSSKLSNSRSWPSERRGVGPGCGRAVKPPGRCSSAASQR